MEKFIIVSEVQATIKIQYIVEADSLAKAEEKVRLKVIEGEVMDETIKWETEKNITGWKDEE